MEGSKRKRPLIYEAPQSKIPRLSAACPCVHSARSAVHNYGNFIKSGPPRRMMFFNDGEWCDFPTDVVVNLIGAFRVRTSAMEISMCGQIFLVDFMHMFMINLKTWAQRSVAWIDESGKCFFPLIFLDSDDALTSRNKIEVDVNFQISETDSSEPRECKKIPDSPVDELEVCSGVKEEVQENDVWVSNSFGFEGLDGKLVQLEKSGNDYITVHNLFLRGLGTFATQNNVIGIYRYAPTGCAALARLQSFEKQMEITKSSRGDANVRQGWYGSSKEGIVRILLHGFGKTGKLSDRMYFSTGVCLAPEDCAHVSASFCDVDENGVQHMLLCRIIMGSMEQVQPGCEQFCPSCEDFDTGVDDLQNPRHYVIWSTQMDTHIHPEYLVSFKLTPSDRACLADLAPSDVDKRNTDVASAEDRQAISTTNPVKNGQNSVPGLTLALWRSFVTGIFLFGGRMGGGKDTKDKGLYSNHGYGLGGYGGYGGYPPPPGAYPPQGYPPQAQGYPPVGYQPSGYPPAGYPPSGYPPAGYPPAGYAGQYQGYGTGGLGSMLAGGAAAAAAAYGTHHLAHGTPSTGYGGTYGYGYGSGSHGHHGKFKHGKFGKHGMYGGGKFKKWK